MSGPLSILSTSKASTAVPLIADGAMAPFRVEALSVDGPDGNRTWPQIKAKLLTTQPMPTSDGGTVNAGFPLFITWPLGTKDDPTTPPEWTTTSFSKFMDGVFGTADAGNKKEKDVRPEFTMELIPSFIGKVVVCKVGVKKPKDEQYTDSNVVKTYTFPADMHG